MIILQKIRMTKILYKLLFVNYNHRTYIEGRQLRKMKGIRRTCNMKKNMRLILSTLIIGLMVLGLVACGEKKASDDTYQDTANQVVKEDNDKQQEDSNTTEDKEDENQEEANNEYYPITVTDRFGNEIVIEKEPEKIISISPEMTETLFALGVGDKVIGRTDYCDFPSEVLEIESIGSLYEVNMEKVIELEADVVFASSHVKDETIDQLTKQGVKIIALSWNENLEGVYGYMTTIGQVVNRTSETGDLVTKMKEVFEQYTKAVADFERPTAYFITGFGKDTSAATGDTFLGQLIEMAGAENAAADGTSWSYSVEKLVEKDPKYLICSSSYDSMKQIEVLDGYKTLTAVKEGRLHEVDENLFFRQGPRLADGFVKLVEIFHPEVLEMGLGK